MVRRRHEVPEDVQQLLQIGVRHHRSIAGLARALGMQRRAVSDWALGYSQPTMASRLKLMDLICQLEVEDDDYGTA